MSVSGSPSAPAPSAVQRQGVSSDAAIPTSLRASTPQGGRPESAVLAARLETQPSGEALERDANQSNLDQRNVDQRNLDQRNLDQRNPLEVTTAEITVAGNLAALEQRLRLPADESRFSSRTESEETGRSEVAKTERSEVTDIERNQAENVERSEVKDVNRSEAKNIVRSEVKNTERSEAKNTERSRAEDSGQSPESRDSAPTSTATSSDALPNAPVLRTAVLDASTSSDPISSDPTRNPAGLVAQATGVARTAQPGLDAAGETESVTGQASRLPPSRADFAPQGTPSAVEVYNPPNRRAAITRPKAEEAPKSEAETLFSTLPDSEPLEWLSRLGSIGAVELDSSSPRVAPALVPVGTAPVGTARSVDPLGAALRAVSPTGEPGPRTASDLSTAPNPSTAPNLNPARFAANSAPTGNALPISSARALEAQRRGSQPLQSEISNPDSASSAGRLAANSEPEMQSNQIGSGSRVAPLVAAPANAAPSQLIATPPSEAMTRGAAPPVRLSMSAQRLIAPITGVDPNSVEIRRDPQSDALTRSYRADALTVDGTVLLSARMVAETPETLGVIAHELTHVARARQPRFVPPALRQPQSLAPDSATRPMTPSLEGLGEEGIALQVEGMTRALAQRGAAQGSRQLSGSSAASGAITPRTSESTPWSDGVLPAPWELMDRLEALTNPGLSAARNQNLHQNPQAGVQPAASQSQQPVRYASPLAVRSEAVAFAGAAVNQSVSSPSSSVAGSGLGGIGGVAAPRNVQAAEQSRSVPTPSPAGPLPKSPPATQKPVGGASPAPDLDDLARQVYAVLKRRLITERRRSS